MARQRRLKALPLAPLRLDRFWLEEFELGTAEDLGANPDQIEYQLVGGSEFLGTPDGDDFLVRLNVGTGRGQAAQPPYHFQVTLAGEFSVATGVPEDERTRLIYVNGTAILYGIARGLLASLTGIGRHGPLHLPSVNFLDLQEDGAAGHGRQSRKPQTKRTRNPAKKGQPGN